MNNELNDKEIIYKFDYDVTDTRDEKEILPEYEEVYEKLDIALSIEKSGYNIYIADDFSNDRINVLVKYLENKISNKSAPKDICYVTDESKVPKVIFLFNGYGRLLKKTINELKEAYNDAVYNFYNSYSCKEKDNILENQQKIRNELILNLSKSAEESGFDVKLSEAGFTFIPIQNGEAMSEREFDTMDLEKKNNIVNKVSELKKIAQEVLEILRKNETNDIKEIRELMKIYLDTKLNDIKERYSTVFSENVQAIEYLDKMCSSVENNIIQEYNMNYDDDEEKIIEAIYKYDINIIVDNSENKCPLVVFEEDPSITNLVGSIDYENKNGAYKTDVSLISAGSILKANEGCIIIRCSDLINNPAAYYNLKKCLLTNKVNLNNKGYFDLLTIETLKPEPINIKLKVILVGDYETYNLLYNYDENFKKIFKTLIERRSIIDINKKAASCLSESINRMCKEDKIKALSQDAFKEMAKFLSRKVESRNKLLLDDYNINRIITMANSIASYRNNEKIEGEDIIKASYEESLIEKDMLENYKNQKILINLKDSRIGQVNGLSIIDTGDYCFGKPLKITCSCYKGEGNIVDVQKESNLSGDIHNKAVNILKSYINRFNNGYVRLPVDFYLCFEQVYGKVDGDSASVGEVICMISALSKIAVKQNIAVTGSINQFGEVQPIGGVNEKIEGFFKVCKEVDSIHGKGVLIPINNKDDLVLSKEVEEAVKLGVFHIYAMTNIDDAIEVLMINDDLKKNDIHNAINGEIKKYISMKK